VRNLASFLISLKYEPPVFEHATWYPNSEANLQRNDDRSMSSPSLVKLGPRTPENHLSKLPTPKIVPRERAKSSITQS